MTPNEVFAASDWITDTNGNRASVAYFGTRDAAIAALDSLENCSTVKNVTKPRVVGPVRSDGYQFVMGENRSVHAGRLAFATMAEARDHWRKTCGGTPLGAETAAILDALEALDRIRNPE